MHRRELLASALLQRRAERPNVLFVMMDDLGVHAGAKLGNRYVATPHLDRLVAEGMTFTQAYATPQCTPTRATLLTGQYTARNRQWHVIPGYGYPQARVEEPPFRVNLPREAFTLAKGLRAAGYATACIGKWHLTANADGQYVGLAPEAATHYGFDAVQTPPARPAQHNQGDKDVDRFTSEALAFIERHRARPWFCYLPHHSIHGVVSAPPALVEKYRARGFPDTGLNNATYLAAMEHYDAALGRLMAGLERLGQARNTIVIFTSDNGGIYRGYQPNPKPVDGRLRLTLGQMAFSNAPLRAGKGFSYEGGLRVPLVVRWPGVTQAGSVCATPVHMVDWMPTFFAAAGAGAPPGYVTDGVDLGPLLRGRRLAARPLYWYHPFYDVRWLATPNAVVRDGEWKLIESFGDFINEEAHAEYRVGRRLELFHLPADPGEALNLALVEPARAERMSRQLHDWIRSTGATVPGLNAAYDPARALLESRRTDLV